MNTNNNIKQYNSSDEGNRREEPASNGPAEVENASSGISSLQSEGSAESNYIDHSRDPRDPKHQIAPMHRRPNFNESLFAILSNQTLSSIITWMPHGRSFTILKTDQFANEVLPKYFRHNNISSFLRYDADTSQILCPFTACYSSLLTVLAGN
jgi:hypothetical protein